MLCGISTEVFSQTTKPDTVTQAATEDAAKDLKKESKKNKKSHARDSTRIKGYRSIYIGAIAGAGYYDVVFDPTVGTSGDISPVFGASFRYESPVNKSIEIELRYRKSGWKSENIYVRDLSIIELPVIAHVSFGHKKTRPFFTLGETVTLIISEKEEFLDPAVEPIFKDHPVDNTVGFSLNLGIGVIRHFTKSAIQFEVRGALALTNIYKPGNELLIDSSNAFFVEGVVKYLFKVK
jgi:hypothetical protein